MPSQQRPPIETYAEAGLVFAGLTWLPFFLARWIVPSDIGDVILLPWIVGIVVGGVALGRYRRVGPAGILGGGLIGVIGGLVVASIATGSDLVSIVIALIAGVAIAFSTLLSWSIRRPHGSRLIPVIAGIIGSVLLLLVTIQLTQ